MVAGTGTADAYGRPRIGSFKSARFRRDTRSIEPLVSGLLRGGLPRRRGWVVVNPPKPGKWLGQVPRDWRWRPKLYVCVMPDHYWETVFKLWERTKRDRLRWKFWTGLRHADRPDKIVVYCRDARDLERVIRLVRPLLAGCRCHSLSSAASTVEMGFERRGRGLYVGADPYLLGQVSWRMYRIAALAYVAKNRARFRTTRPGLEQWLKRLNVSVAHGGPHRLNPPPRHDRYVKECWQGACR